MHVAQAQEQPEAPDPVLHPATDGVGAQVPAEKVFVHRGTGRVLGAAEAHRAAGQDLVPGEQFHQGKHLL